MCRIYLSNDESYCGAQSLEGGGSVAAAADRVDAWDAAVDSAGGLHRQHACYRSQRRQSRRGGRRKFVEGAGVTRAKV